MKFHDPEQQAITNENAPKPVGPYSQAIAWQNLVFTAGQIALDPQTGELDNADFDTEAKRVISNLKAVLEAAGASFQTVLKTTVYLTDLNNFQAFNTLYAMYFSEPYPARTLIQAAKLPKGASVEVEVVAYHYA